MKVLNKKIGIIVLALVFSFVLSTSVFAAGNPGVEFANWAKTQIVAIFGVIMAGIGLVILVKRKVVQGVIFLLIAGIAAIFVFGGTDMAQKLQQIITSWF